MALSAPAPLRTSIGSAILTIMLAGIVAGTLDILGAFAVYGHIVGNTPPGRILQAVARGVFGNAAFSGGANTAYWGLALHYMIAFLFAIAYFLWFPYIPFLQKHKVVSGLLYGVFIWMLMNFVIVPGSNAGAPSYTMQNIAWGLALNVFLVGLPISLIVHYSYTRKL